MDEIFTITRAHELRKNLYARFNMLQSVIITIALICIFTCECVNSEFQKPTEDANQDSPVNRPGHLKPLGWGKERLPVDVVRQYLLPTDFFANYVYASKPVIFKGVAETANAFQYWTDTYLSNLPESSSTKLDVEHHKKENRSDPTVEMSVKEFINRYKNEDLYLVADVPSYLRKDVPIPKSLICNDVLNKLVATVMWISNGGTKSVLHNDDVDNINCLYSGKKDILFIDFKYRENVTLDRFEGGYSSVDVDKVDFLKYPGLSQVEFHYAEMSQGDCIFIPYKWFHQVNSHNRNLAVNLWWAHDGNILPTLDNCGSPDEDLSLADIKLKDENSTEDEPENNYFQDTMSFVLDGGKFSLAGLKSYLKTHPRLTGLTWSEECDRIVDKVFNLMDTNDDGVLHSEDIEERMMLIEDEVEFNLNILQDILLLEIGQQRRKELLQDTQKQEFDHMLKEEL